jgi:hypothetical protein
MSVHLVILPQAVSWNVLMEERLVNETVQAFEMNECVYGERIW